MYDSVRRPFGELGRNKLQFTESMYNRSRAMFQELVATPSICSIYAQRWLVILDWLAEKIDARQAAEKLTDLSSTLSDVHEANLTRACAMIILARDGHMTLAREMFGQCRSEFIPRWDVFVFHLHREFNEYVKSQAPNVDRLVENRIVQTARTAQQWQELEAPLRKAQTAYADYLEYDFLPMAARYIMSDNTDQYRDLERTNFIRALRRLTVSHHRCFYLGATTGPIAERVRSRILPKVLAVWERDLALYNNLPLVAVEEEEIKELCKKLGISEDSLPKRWQELIEEKQAGR